MRGRNRVNRIPGLHYIIASARQRWNRSGSRPHHRCSAQVELIETRPSATASPAAYAVCVGDEPDVGPEQLSAHDHACNREFLLAKLSIQWHIRWKVLYGIC